MNITALLKLPRPFTRSARIQPATLPIDCGENVYDVQVIAAGNGKKELDRNATDTKLNHVFLQTMKDDKECQINADYKNEYGSIICAYSNDGQAVYTGDLGEFVYETIYEHVQKHFDHYDVQRAI